MSGPDEEIPLRLPANEVQTVIAACNPVTPPGVARTLIAKVVRDYLAHADVCARLHVEGATISTGTMAEILFPEQLARGELIDRRKRLFQILQDIARKDVEDCASRGHPKLLRGREVRPWRWHPPRPLDTWDEIAKSVGITRGQAKAVAQALGFSGTTGSVGNG